MPTPQVYQRVAAERDRLESERASLADVINTALRENGPIDVEQATLKSDLRPLVNKLVDYCNQKRRDAELQKDELRKVLSALVHSIEDTWHHIPPCDVGTERQHADTECVCGPDVEDALQVLFKTGKGAEKRVGD